MLIGVVEMTALALAPSASIPLSLGAVGTGRAPVAPRASFADLARAHRGELLRLARRLCRSRDEADDLVQDVMVKVLAHHDRLPPTTNLAAWMTRVLYNLFIDRLRQRRRGPWVELDEGTAAAPPAEEPAWWDHLTRADIEAALAEVPEELRRTFELFAFEHCAYAEIARRLGVPSATVGTRLLRARRHLCAALTRRHAS